MEQQNFSIIGLIETSELRIAERYAIEGIAAKALHAAGVELSIDERRSGFMVLSDMESQLIKTNPHELGDAKTAIMAIIAGIARATNTNSLK